MDKINILLGGQQKGKSQYQQQLIDEAIKRGESFQILTSKKIKTIELTKDQYKVHEEIK